VFPPAVQGDADVGLRGPEEALHLVTSEVERHFPGQVFVAEPIKFGDFTCVCRLRMKTAVENSASWIGKVCSGPMATEAGAYMAVGSSHLMPRCHHARWLTPRLAVLLLEDIGGPLLRDEPSSTRSLQTLADLLRFQVGMQSQLDVLTALGLRAALPQDFRNQAEQVLLRCGFVAGKTSRSGGRIDDALHICHKAMRRHPVTLVHGDLYGDNVVWSSEGPKVIDWGFAHLGVGIMDVASLLTQQERKNGKQDIEEAAQVKMYYDAAHAVQPGMLEWSDCEEGLLVGRILVILAFLSWLCFRVESWHWRIGDPAETIALHISQLDGLANDLLLRSR
jgi:hypothetical protein